MNQNERTNLPTVQNFIASKYPTASFWGIYDGKYTVIAAGIFIQVSLETGVVRRTKSGKRLGDLQVKL
jgi:hypothetical protein